MRYRELTELVDDVLGRAQGRILLEELVLDGLGNRTGAFSVFSVLRGIEESRADVPASWVLPHVYAERTSLSPSQTGEGVVQEAARQASASRWTLIAAGVLLLLGVIALVMP